MENSGATNSHFMCRIHKASQVQTKQFDLVSEHVSGLLHCALSMRGGGNRNTLRKMLFGIIQDKLVIHVGEPPEQYVSHRKAIFDLFLSTPLNEHGKAPLQRAACQRAVLSHFFAGDLQNEAVVEYWAPEPMSRQRVLRLYETVAIPMLLPSVCPIFPRSRWIGGELSVNFAGLLSSIHGLLTPLLLKWGAPTGLPQPVGPGATSLQTYLPGWQFVAASTSTPASDSMGDFELPNAGLDGAPATEYDPVIL